MGKSHHFGFKENSCYAWYGLNGSTVRTDEGFYSVPVIVLNIVSFHYLILLKRLIIYLEGTNRSSLSKVSYKNYVLKKLAKFTGKHVCRSFLFNMVSFYFQIYKKKTLVQVLLWDESFLKFFGTSFSWTVCERLNKVRAKIIQHPK